MVSHVHVSVAGAHKDAPTLDSAADLPSEDQAAGEIAFDSPAMGIQATQGGLTEWIGLAAAPALVPIGQGGQIGVVVGELGVLGFGIGESSFLVGTSSVHVRQTGNCTGAVIPVRGELISGKLGYRVAVDTGNWTLIW